MDLHLKGKKAVILGGTRGIGRAIADTLADEGADVALCARNGDQVKDAVAALKDKGVKATGSSVDIMDTAALKAWIDAAAKELGGIDVLVSNAGAMAQGNSEDAWTANFKLDLLGGAVAAFDAAAPHLEKAAEAGGDASFVIISSVSAAETDRADSYGPIKAALIHHAKGLAREFAPKKVRINVVSPGTVFFEGGVWGNVKQGMPDFFNQMIARNPTGRMATPQEIANATVFLSSPVSAFTTGINMVVDGAISRRVNF
ncbi:MAG: SDR family oxidoreductase [Alphaproteobacteria bacterium]|nr:SDR family oxidoreductase [Alphaproteobacteria bacterium]